MPGDAWGCEAKKPTVQLSVNLRVSVLTGGDVADSQKNGPSFGRREGKIGLRYGARITNPAFQRRFAPCSPTLHVLKSAHQRRMAVSDKEKPGLMA